MKSKTRTVLATASVISAIAGSIGGAVPGQRFSQGAYYNKYDVGLTTYPGGVTYLGSVERACGHSNF